MKFYNNKNNFKIHIREKEVEVKIFTFFQLIIKIKFNKLKLH
jgi:hypothetical protein